MRITVDLNLEPLITLLAGEPGSRAEAVEAKAKKRLAYATVNALNWSALYVQKDAVKNVEERFTIRTTASRALLTRQAAVLQNRASVGASRYYVDLFVGGGQLRGKSPLLLPEFEAGAEKRPVTPGAKRVAIPITGTARPSFASPVTPSLRISALGLKPQFSKSVGKHVANLVRSTKSRSSKRAIVATLGAGQVWRGKFGTFMFPKVGIFQRTGPGRGGVRLLYAFDADVRLPADLHFLDVAQESGKRYLEREFSREVADVLAGRKTQAAPRRL